MRTTIAGHFVLSLRRTKWPLDLLSVPRPQLNTWAMLPLQLPSFSLKIFNATRDTRSSADMLAHEDSSSLNHQEASAGVTSIENQAALFGWHPLQEASPPGLQAPSHMWHQS